MINYTEKEIIENGKTYIVREYESGTVAKWEKKDDQPIEQPEPTVTNEDIMNKLNEMSSEQVSKESLDAAYREGVNSYE